MVFSQQKKSPRDIDLRISIMIVGQFVVAVIFILRLFQIQVLEHDKYKAMAQDQYWSLQEIPAKRGNILSADGFPLATTQISYMLYAQPHLITDPLQVAHDVATALVNERSYLYEDSDQKAALFDSYKDRFYEILSLDLKWAILEHYLSEQEKVNILSLTSAGLGFEEEPKRYYPEDTLASHVLGFVAKNETGEQQGYFGVEGSFNGELKGKSGKINEQLDALGQSILVGEYTKTNPIDGRDVVLTINRAVQYIVEDQLEEGVKKHGAVSGSVVVMDPFTGNVVAMANYPTYHPSNYVVEEKSDDSKEEQYTTEIRNLSISETYEPGSVLKGLTVSAGIDLGKVKPETTFDDRGPVTYSDYTIDNWDQKHHGLQTITQLLQKSNNIGAAWVGHVVGRKSLHKYFTKFGLGEITGVDLEGEDTGIIRSYKEWTDIDTATAAFGQGVSTTPLQVLNAFNAVANGGNLMRPRIASKVIEGQKIITIPEKKIREVISQESSDTMVNMLTEAVIGGESKYYNIKTHKIAGKTGTAQIPVEGKYDPTKTNTTFVGFLPTSKQFSMIVKLDRPSSSVYASETAVPLWMGIADSLIKYYGIPPDM